MDRARFCAFLAYVSFGYMAILGVAQLSAAPQNEDRRAPVVAAASVPLYPRTALLAHIEGTVKIQVATDGRKVSSLQTQSGPPLLARAAEENVRTWEFDEHKPTTFLATFEYRLQDPGGCSVENEEVLVRMPTYVRVTAKRVHTCDPISKVP